MKACTIMIYIHMISSKLKHYFCTIDLLGHAGHLEETESVIKETHLNHM
jgi:hypothetical protein